MSSRKAQKVRIVRITNRGGKGGGAEKPKGGRAEKPKGGGAEKPKGGGLRMGLRIAGAVCLLYFIVLAAGLGAIYLFNWFWVAAGVLMLAAAAWLPEWYRLPPGIRLVVKMVMVVCLLAFIAGESLILLNAGEPPPKGVDYVVVLGAKVNGATPSLTLKYRIDKAYDYLRENPDTVVVASGGQGPNEGISEASAMFNRFVGKGISPERILLEDRSTSTTENLVFSRECIAAAAAAQAAARSQMDSGQESVREPESGRESIREPQPQPDQESGRESMREPEPQPQQESGRESMREPQPQPKQESGRESIPEPEPQPQLKQESGRESIPEPEPQPQQESGRESMREPQPQPSDQDRLQAVGQSVVIVSSDFHLFRAKAIARKLGYKQVYGLGARSVPWLLPNYCVREFFAIVKDGLMGNLKLV